MSGSASNETIRTHAENDTGKINIHCDNIQAFSVDRGMWFKAGLISRFRDRMPAGFWGQGGRLNLIPASVVLVRGVHITVETSTEVTDYLFNKRTVGGSAGFSIGPWRVGGGGSRTTIEESYSMNRTANGFEIKDTSGRGQALAVISIKNADLLTSPPSTTTALYRTLSKEQVAEGRQALAFAQVDPVARLEAFGLKVPS